MNPTNPMNSINPEHTTKGYATVNSRLFFNKNTHHQILYPISYTLTPELGTD